MTAQSANTTEVASLVPQKERARLTGFHGATVWLTGLSGSGKSSIALELERIMLPTGQVVCLLDGDNLRQGVNADLGFSAHDRAEAVRRAGEVALLCNAAGAVAVVSLISPYKIDRARVRSRHRDAGLRFLEVHVDTPLEVCESRDPKGLYARARLGEIEEFTGISAPYEPPHSPEMRTVSAESALQSAERIARLLGRYTPHLHR